MRRTAASLLRALNVPVAPQGPLWGTPGWRIPAQAAFDSACQSAAAVARVAPAAWVSGSFPASVDQRRSQADDASLLAPCERQPEQQAVNALDSELEQAAQSGGPEAVLAVIEREGEHFTELNVVTAMQQLAAAMQRGSSSSSSGMSAEEIVRSASFQALVDMVLAGMMRFQPSLLAEAIRSCGDLGASEEMLLDEIARHIMKHPEQLLPADIAGLVSGYAALDHSPGVILFDTLAARAEEVAQQFTDEQRQQVAAAYQQLGYGSKVPRL